MRRCWLIAAACALLLTAGAWGALRVYRENSASGFAERQELFRAELSAGDEGIRVGAVLLGRGCELWLDGGDFRRLLCAARAAWLLLPPGARAVYTLAALAAAG